MDKAEEILSKHTGEMGVYLTKGLIRGSDALEAMEEYAKYYHREQVKFGLSNDVKKTCCPNQDCKSKNIRHTEKYDYCEDCRRIF